MKTILGTNLYTVQEVSEMLGVSTTTVHTYIKNKTLHARKIGRMWYVSEQIIKEYIGAGGTKDNE